MKKILFTLCALAALVSCDGGRYFPEDHGNNGHPNDRPVNDKTVNVMDGAFAYYWGDSYNAGSDNYTLFLHTGTYTDDGFTFVNSGTEVAIDMFCQKSGQLKIAPGTYTCSGNNYSAGHFLSGVTEDETVYPSYVYVQRSNKENDFNIYLITGGTITVNFNGGNYTIEGEVNAGEGKYYFKYSGKIEITDGSRQVLEMDTAQGKYFGDIYAKKLSDYELVLSNADGMSVAFDFLAPFSDKTDLPAGKYTCSSFDDAAAFTFLDGEEDGDYVYPTYICNEAGKEVEIYLVTDGTVDVSVSKGSYTIEADLVANGQSYSVSYSGPVTFENGNDNPEIPENVEMTNIGEVVAECWGPDMWSWDDATIGGINDWMVYFYAKDYDETGEYAVIEILTSDKDKTLVPGTYKVTAGTQKADYVPFSVISGTWDEDGTIYGTWYCYGEDAIYAATKGSLYVMQDEEVPDTYVINFSFIDEDETYGGTFKGSYIGGVKYSYKSKASASGLSKSARAYSLPKAVRRAEPASERAVKSSAGAATASKGAVVQRPASRKSGRIAR